MARGTKETPGTTALRDIGYARQVSKDVQEEKLKEPHTRPPDEKTNSPGCPQRQSTSNNTMPCPLSKTLVGTNFEDILVDGKENSDSNEKRLKQPANQFSNDLNTSVISNRLSREIQDLNIIPTGSDKPGDGMNEYLIESRSAGGSTKPPECNPKELADNVTDEEKTLTNKYDNLNLTLSTVVEVEPVDSALLLENDATEADTECNGGFVNDATLEVLGDSINSSSRGTGIVEVNSPDDTGSLDNQCIEVRSGDDIGSLDSHSVEVTSCDDGSSLDSHSLEVTSCDNSGSLDSHSVEVASCDDTGSLDNQCIEVRSGDDIGSLDSHSVEVTSCDDGSSLDSHSLEVISCDNSGSLDSHSVEVASCDDTGSLDNQCIEVRSGDDSGSLDSHSVEVTSCDDGGSLDSHSVEVASCDDGGSLDRELVKASSRDDTGSLNVQSMTVNNPHSPEIDGNISHATTKKEIQIAEVKSQDDGERFKPDNYQTPNEHSVRDKNVCPSGRPAAGSESIDFKQLGIQHHNERLGEKCQCEPRSAFHKHNDIVFKSTEKERKTYLERHKQSVGYIQLNGLQIGTCFRVGPKWDGFVMTAYHVFYDLYLLQNKIPTETNLNRLCHLSIKIFFPDWKTDNHWYKFKPVIHNGCPKLDYVLLELEGDEFPEPFQDFGRVREDMPNFLHSYQDTSMKIDYRVKILNVTEEDVRQATYHCQKGYNLYEPYIHNVSEAYKHTVLDKEKVPIWTELRHGASGSPGLHINDDGSTVLTNMYLRGYPSEYYIWPKDQLDRSTFPPCLLVEQALKIVEIYDRLNHVDSDLAKCVFPSIVFD